MPKTTNQYKGQFVLVNPEKWRIKGTFGQAAGGNYAQVGTSGSGSGTGTVYYWNGTTWMPASGGSAVTFTISFTDNGSAKKATADTFAIHVTYDAVANGYPAATYGTFPNFTSTPIRGGGGNITVSSK